MRLPVMPPVSPMLSKPMRELPEREDVLYEPKWDGFRAVVFRDGAQLELGSRNERPLTRYFPELVESLGRGLPERCVLDGEIVIAGPDGLDFEALLQRIHPAESRVRLLSERTPASFVAFDLLAVGDEDLRGTPFGARRARLEKLLRRARPPLHLTPATRRYDVALAWLSRFEGAGLDGVMVKPLALPYLEGKREMLKVKHARTADCVVAGFRWHKDGEGIGSLLLGLHDAAGNLQYAGAVAGFNAAVRRALVQELEPLRMRSTQGHPWAAVMPSEDVAGRRPGGPSRWTAQRDMSWEPLRAERVIEVAYDHLQGERFRHVAKFVRWRPDRSPSSCTYAQLESAVPTELSEVFGAAIDA